MFQGLFCSHVVSLGLAVNAELQPMKEGVQASYCELRSFML